MCWIILAMLAMTWRVTILGISHLAGKSGSYRTVQRFFSESTSRGQVFCDFSCKHLYQPENEYILVGDESVITKAGIKMCGLDRFFTSLSGKPVKAIAEV